MASRSNPVYCAVDTIDIALAAKLIRSAAGGPLPAVGGIKLGLEFFLAHGAPGVRYAFPAPVRATGVGFFLDLKLHDIPNTVAGGIRAVAESDWSATFTYPTGAKEAIEMAKSILLDCATEVPTTVTVVTTAITPENAKSMMTN